MTTANSTLLCQLPLEILRHILTCVDVPSVCRLYIAYHDHPFQSVIADYLDTLTIDVTPEITIDGDPRYIDFDTVNQLPPCNIRVTMTHGLLRLTSKYLWNTHFKRLSFHIRKGEGCSSYADLLGFVEDLTSLTGEWIDINPRHIPKTVEELDLRHCSFLPRDKFTHLTRLEKCNFFSCCTDQLRLPPQISSLNYFDHRNLDLSGLENLKHLTGERFDNIPWAQLITLRDGRLPESPTNMDQMREIHLIEGNASFKHITCPQLKSIEYDIEEHYNVCDLLTFEQQAQLQSLKGRWIYTYDVSAFEHLKVLHMEMVEPLTEHYRLPPRLTELKVWTSYPIYGIPSQLERFEVGISGLSTVDVTVKSARLRRLVVQPAKTVVIDCPRVTSLKLGYVDNLEEVDTPNVVKLDLDSTKFPLEKLPRLNELFTISVDQDVVVKHHLQSVTLMNMKPKVVSVSADFVTVAYDLTGELDIRTKVFTSHAYQLIHTKGIVCQELICANIGKVPACVEKLTLDGVTPEWNIRPPPPETVPLDLTGCTKLKSIYIKQADFRDVNKPIIPASVQHLRFGDIHNDDTPFRYENQENLRYFECLGQIYFEDIGLTKMPKMSKTPHLYWRETVNA